MVSKRMNNSNRHKKKSMTITRIVAFVIIGILLPLIVYYIYHPKEHDIEIKTNSFVDGLIQNRRKFHSDCNRHVPLIQAYENNTHFLSIKNHSKKIQLIKDPDIFYSIKKIEELLQLDKLKSDNQKIEKIHNFVEKHRKSTRPLYESSEMHDPVYFFNVYGCGFCDDAAQNMALLANHFGYNSRIHWLEGHVVSSIFHDAKWRIYDPDALGIVKIGNQVATIDDMVQLAKENKLERYNEAYSTIDNNRISSVIKRWKSPIPTLNMLPNEKRFFYKDAFMLSNDGHYLSYFKSVEDYFTTYRGTIANFVKEIPLSVFENDSNQIELTDYFPLCGLFISLPNRKGIISDNEYPIVKINTDLPLLNNQKKTEFPKKPIYRQFKGFDVVGKSRSMKYLDLSLCLKNLEFRPSHSVQISNLNILSKINGAKLISVHYYSIKNLILNKNSLKNLEQKGVIVKTINKKSPFLQYN